MNKSVHVPSFELGHSSQEIIHDGFIQSLQQHYPWLQITEKSSKNLLNQADFPPLPTNISGSAQPNTAAAVSGDSVLFAGAKESYANTVLKLGGIIAAAYPPQDPHPSSFPLPENEGDFFSITIPEETYHNRIESFKNSFLGRISYMPREKPWSTKDLKKKLQEIWQVRGIWRFTPLGKGYFNIFFAEAEERVRIFARRSWPVVPGTFRLNNWSPDFNPFKLISSKAQVRVRFHELLFEYWDSSIIWAMASTVGVPLRIDENLVNGSYGCFARVLIEVDFKNEIRDKILIKRKGHCCFAFVVIENSPDFCTHCGIIGHNWRNCRKRERPMEILSPKQQKETDKIWVTKVDSRATGIGKTAAQDISVFQEQGNGVSVATSTTENLISVGIANKFQPIFVDEEKEDLMDEKDSDGEEMSALVDPDLDLATRMVDDEMHQKQEKKNFVSAVDSGIPHDLRDCSKEPQEESEFDRRRRLSLENYERLLKASVYPPKRKLQVSAPAKFDIPARRELRFNKDQVSDSNAAMASAAIRDFSLEKPP